MKRLLRSALLCCCGAAVFSPALLGQTPPQQPALPVPSLDNWYRVELLVFARTDNESRSSEQFDPLPDLSYPDRYRFLIDPTLADRRAQEHSAYASTFDGRGLQRLTLPAPVNTFDPLPRPDALLVEDPEAPTGSESAADGGAQDADTTAPQTGTTATDQARTPGIAEPGAAAPAADEADLLARERAANAPLLAHPYLQLPRQALEFTAEAAQLRRRGNTILFHGAWWAPFDERERMLPIALDRSGDPDRAAWPELQGSVLLYLSRYLHLEVDLWLNTDGAYLPAAWTIDPPPLAVRTLAAQGLDGRPIDPFAPPETLLFSLPGGPDLEPDRPDGRLEGTVLDPLATEEDEGLAAYPFRHAITHRQKRRMRSEELHYLDHPVLGVVVRLMPVSEEMTPWLSPDWLPFYERHQLPVIRKSPEDQTADGNR